ncbi:IS66 family insertion sequence element accessory protein TnpA [Alkalimarinus alittae]|uniref:Transposase n=1 Tax=Alkalimarinus alittae TaxID=2961619 RepID=A0ABY6MX39_9ALTE|nr:hypothetical protein [Alkalimarinus alittae]UZE94388.1 hypothetical protein NKI27_09795 [Alkalimarinus alittae]
MKKSKRNYTHRSLKDWATILTAFENSGLTQEAFCQQNKLPSSTFSKWKKQLSKNTLEQPAFIELPMTEAYDTSSAFCFELNIALRNGFKLNLRLS